MYIQTDADTPGAYAEIGSGKTEIRTTLETLLQYIRQLEVKTGKKIHKIKLAHSHNRPLLEDAGYSSEDVAKMESGELESPSAPPSFPDIYSSIEEGYFFKQYGIEVRDEVFDSNGKWIYSIEPNSETNKIIDIESEEIKLILEKIKSSPNLQSPELFKALGQQSVTSLKVHPRDQLKVMAEDKDTAELAKQISEIRTQLDNKYPGTYQEIKNITFLQGDILKAVQEGRSKDYTREKMQAYADNLDKYGIKIQYLRNKPPGNATHLRGKRNMAKR
jgi:hypothetical protein